MKIGGLILLIVAVIAFFMGFLEVTIIVGLMGLAILFAKESDLVWE